MSECYNNLNSVTLGISDYAFCNSFKIMKAPNAWKHITLPAFSDPTWNHGYCSKQKCCNGTPSCCLIKKKGKWKVLRIQIQVKLPLENHWKGLVLRYKIMYDFWVQFAFQWCGKILKVMMQELLIMSFMSEKKNVVLMIIFKIIPKNIFQEFCIPQAYYSIIKKIMYFWIPLVSYKSVKRLFVIKMTRCYNYVLIMSFPNIYFFF